MRAYSREWATIGGVSISFSSSFRSISSSETSYPFHVSLALIPQVTRGDCSQWHDIFKIILYYRPFIGMNCWLTIESNILLDTSKKNRLIIRELYSTSHKVTFFLLQRYLWIKRSKWERRRGVLLLLRSWNLFYRSGNRFISQEYIWGGQLVVLTLVVGNVELAGKLVDRFKSPALRHWRALKRNPLHFCLFLKTIYGHNTCVPFF